MKELDDVNNYIFGKIYVKVFQNIGNNIRNNVSNNVWGSVFNNVSIDIFVKKNVLDIKINQPIFNKTKNSFIREFL